MTELGLMIYAAACFLVMFCTLRKYRGEFLDEDDFAVAVFFGFLGCVIFAPLLVSLHILWFISDLIIQIGKLMVRLFGLADKLLSRKE